MNIKVSVNFYKVVVLSIGIFETVIVDERHFSNKESAVAYTNTLAAGLVGVLVEV